MSLCSITISCKVAAETKTTFQWLSPCKSSHNWYWFQRFVSRKLWAWTICTYLDIVSYCSFLTEGLGVKRVAISQILTHSIEPFHGYNEHVVRAYVAIQHILSICILYS
jgi:hypothetical protein